MSPFDLTKTLAFGALAALCLTGVSSAQVCPADDAFEPNDDCASATPLPLGALPNLAMAAGTNVSYVGDFYSYTVANGEAITLDVLFIDANGDIDLRLFDDAACANQVAGAGSVDDNETMTWVNASGAAVTVTMEVFPWDVPVCNDYSINVATFADPCFNPVDDIFEPNDSCGAGVPLPAGNTLNLFATDVNEDYYQIAVPVAAILTVDLTYNPLGGDVDMLLYSDNTCATQLDSDFTVGGTGQVVWSNATGVAQLVTLRCTIAAGEDCNTYELNVSVPPDPCLQGLDDSHEPNDSCAAAGALGAGLESNLFVSEASQDNYTIAVAAGDMLTVDLAYVSGINADPDMILFDDLVCASQVANSFGFGGTGQVVWSNATGVAATVVLNVSVPLGEGCNLYDLNVSTVADPCLDPASEDGFAPNQDCATAYPIVDGTYPGLFVAKVANDYFSLTIADGDTLDLSTVSVQSEIDLYLWDDAGANCGDLNVWLARGFALGPDENIFYTNMTGASMSVTVGVIAWDDPNEMDCTDYDMDITGSGGSFATPFCFGDGSVVACPCVNESVLGAGEGCLWSGGVGAILTATGSNSVAADDIQFHVSQARASQPSMLVQGSTIIGVPFKDGILCMGNPTERVEVVFLDGNGDGSSLSSIITEGNVSPGDMRYYQQWFRDPGGISPCGTGSNFTQGLIVTYNI